jgi:hypothetical protein
MHFNQTEIEHLERILGYVTLDPDIRAKLSVTFTDNIVYRCKAIMVELDEIDVLLKDATAYSFVIESKESKLAYANHIKHLKIQGSRLLKELAYNTQVEVKYDKYTDIKDYSKSTVSYW